MHPERTALLTARRDEAITALKATIEVLEALDVEEFALTHLGVHCRSSEAFAAVVVAAAHAGVDVDVEDRYALIDGGPEVRLRQEASICPPRSVVHVWGPDA